MKYWLKIPYSVKDVVRGQYGSLIMYDALLKRWYTKCKERVSEINAYAKKAGAKQTYEQAVVALTILDDNDFASENRYE